jgi:hypothetical protein
MIVPDINGVEKVIEGGFRLVAEGENVRVIDGEDFVISKKQLVKMLQDPNIEITGVGEVEGYRRPRPESGNPHRKKAGDAPGEEITGSCLCCHAFPGDRAYRCPFRRSGSCDGPRSGYTPARG